MAYSAQGQYPHQQTKSQQAKLAAKEAPNGGSHLRHRDRAANHSQPTLQQQATKGGTKQQLARDYYMMQGQPTHLAPQSTKHDSGSRPTNDQTPQSKRTKSKEMQQNFDQSNQHQSQSAGSQQQSSSRSTKALLPSTQSAYYAYTMTKHAKAEMNGGTRRSSTGNSATCSSDPQTQKRQVQSAHGSERTPKTPTSANIFRRKWGGASSTKSQKSVSSNRSIGMAATSAMINCGESPGASATKSAQAPGEITYAASATAFKQKRTVKKEKSRPNSSSKTTKLDGYSTLKTAVGRGAAKESPNMLTVFETPPIALNKAVRSSSNEVKGEQIDFTQIARNRLLTMSNKKQFGNLQNPHATSSSAQVHGFGGVVQSPPSQTAGSNQMPPRHQPRGMTAAVKGSTKRRVSKSKSITRQNNASTATPAALASSSAATSQKCFKTNTDRNGGGMPPQQSSAQSSQLAASNNGGTQSMQVMQTIDNSASRSKKLKTLLNSATGNKEQCKNGSDVGGVGTPRRNSIQKGQTIDSISNRRVSQQPTPPKKGKANQATTQYNSVRQRKHLTPVMLSRDKLPPQQPGSTAKISQTMKQSQVMMSNNETARSATNTCQSNQGQHSYDKKRNEVDSTTKKSSQPSTTGKEGGGGKGGGEKQWKSHRSHLSTQHVEPPAFLQQAATGNRNRNRSSSNQKQQQSTNSAVQTQTNLNSNYTVKEPSQTDTKRKEPGKRKKSQTRRGKSAKIRGRSPHRAPGPPTVPTERYHSPQINAQTFQHFRQRLLKPKKPNSSGDKEYLTAKQGGFSADKADLQQITVGMLNTDSKALHHTRIVNSCSAGNSVSSATNITKKEAKLRNQNQQQKMLSNIQSQIIGGGSSKVLGSKKAAYKAETAVKKEKRKSNQQESSRKVDLLKASLMTDIRIEPRQQRQSQELNTPSQSSVKSSKQKRKAYMQHLQHSTHQPLKQHQISTENPLPSQKHDMAIQSPKTRSVSSDERLRTSQTQSRNHHTEGGFPNSNTGSAIYISETKEDIIQTKGNNGSPKYLLSLSQLQNLLLSTTKISQNLKKKSNTSTKGVSKTQSKKELIELSLKAFQSSSSKPGGGDEASTKQQQQHLYQTEKVKKQLYATFNKSGEDHQLISIQPTDLQVFNTISERSSINIKKEPSSPNVKSQQTTSVQQMMLAHDSTKLRHPGVKIAQEDDKQRSKFLSQLTSRGIQARINLKSHNLLSLVELQKLRAKKMSSTQKLEPFQQQHSQSTKVMPTVELYNVEEIAMPATQTIAVDVVQKPTEDGREFHHHTQNIVVNQPEVQKKNTNTGEPSQQTSSQRLQSKFYAKLESRSRQEVESRVASSAQSSPKSKTVQQHQPKEELVPELQNSPDGFKEATSKALVRAEVENRSTSSRKSFNNNDSFLGRVEQENDHHHQHQQHQVRERSHSQRSHSSRTLSKQDKDASMYSLKQPSLRQITSSHTSRSNKRMTRQESTDYKKSQDPNASITLSRILLETSMQQSEHGLKDNSNKQQYQQQKRNSIGAQIVYQPSAKSRLKSTDLVVATNEAMSYQSINSPQSMSQHQISEQQSKYIQRSMTNPEKLSGMNSNATSKQQKSPLQNFMADEVWPTGSSHRKRTSSISSLSNSTHQSRTLEKLQQNQIGILPAGSSSVYPAPINEQFRPILQDNHRRRSQQEFLEDGQGSYQLVMSPITLHSEQTDPQLVTMDGMNVQDQGAPQTASSVGSLSHRNSEEQDKIDQEAMISRGTSSPERRRTPSKKTEIMSIQPIQLDNSTSFNNDGDYELPTDSNLNDVPKSPTEDDSQLQNFQQLKENNNSQQIENSPVENHSPRAMTRQENIRRMLNRSEGGANESYEEAPFEKSQNEGLNLILFQGPAGGSSGNNNFRDGETGSDFEADENQEGEQNLLTSINENGSSSTLEQQNQLATATQVVLSPHLQVTSNSMAGYWSNDTLTDGGPSQLAPIEDVMRLSPHENVVSLVSLDSDNLTALEQAQNQQIINNTQDSCSPPMSPKTEDCTDRGQKEAVVVEVPSLKPESSTVPKLHEPENELAIKSMEKERHVESPLEMIITLGHQSTSELKTPCRDSKHKNQQRSTLLSYAEPNKETPTSCNEIVDHDHITFTIERQDRPVSVSGGDTFPGASVVCSADLEFEEAVNTELSPIGNAITAAAKLQQHQSHLSPTLSHSSQTLQSAKTAAAAAAGASTVATGLQSQGRMIDIDSLNEIKKANDLASKKVEMTNYVFEMLVNEVKDSLFPHREDEDVVEDSSNTLGGDSATKKSESKRRERKRKVARKVRKPNVFPKVKELKDGVPVDTCLKRIQMQARVMRKSTASVENLGVSLSQTASLSMSKEDDGVSYLDQTKSKEQLEASTQFSQLEICKQEQLEFLQRQIAVHEEEENAKKKDDDDLKKLQLNLRGIKTTTEVVDQYLNTLFETLIENEQEFLDNLATPFSLNPLQELIDVQVLARQSKLKLPLCFNKSRKLLSEGKIHASQFSTQENELEAALFGFQQQQHPVLSVEIYLDIERRKDYVLLADSISELNMSLEEESMSQSVPEDGTGENQLKPHKQSQPLVENQSMLAEWENIHNKVLFDAVNDSLDDFRPYGLRGPPAPWSGQTRALTYRYSQNAKEVLQQVRDKVIGLSKTFGGALANSELLREYHIRGPLEHDKLQMLREERLTIMMMQDVEETQHKWEDLEKQETGVKIDLTEMLLEQLTMELVAELAQIGSRDFGSDDGNRGATSATVEELI